MKGLRKILWGGMLGVLLSISGVAADTRTLVYDVQEKGRHLYTIIYKTLPTSQKKDANIKIISTIDGPGVQEKNICILNTDHSLFSIEQDSKNQHENSNYTWKITSTTKAYDAYYLDHSDNTEIKKPVTFPDKAFSLQGLLYHFRDMDFRGGDSHEFKLLVPVSKFYKIYADVIGIRPLNLKDKTVSCYQVQLGFRGLIGLIIPEMTFWFTASKPHIPIRYTQQNRIYTLKKETVQRLY